MTMEMPAGDSAALVDNEDYQLVSKYNWHLDKDGYAVTKETVNGKRIKVTMHRLVMGLENGNPLQVDHINRKKLDNRKSNLRLVKGSREQQQNRGGSKTSRYTGVSWHKGTKKWRTQIQIEGKVTHLGYYHDEEKAREAYQEALSKIKEKVI